METDADTSSKVLFFLEQFWSFFAVSLGVALGGVTAKRVVAVLVPAERTMTAAEAGGGGPYRSTAAEIAMDPKLPLWYRLWRASISLHPVFVGGACGFAPIPVANWVPDGSAAHVLWFALAGALSGQVFEMGKRLTEIIPAVVRQKLGLRSERPPAMPDTADTAKTEKDAADPGALPKE